MGRNYPMIMRIILEIHLCLDFSITTGNDTIFYRKSTFLLLRSRLGRLALFLGLLLRLLFNGGLLLPHSVVATLQRQQLGMRAALDNIALVEDNDLVRCGDRGQTVTVVCVSKMKLR